MLEAEGWTLRELDGVGVVSGPGSFTGMRTGLAVAKGLCEAASLPLAAVSRLAVLAEAAEAGGGFAVLRAGRDELYVRDVSYGREWMCGIEEFRLGAKGARVVVAEARVAERLAEMKPKLHPLRVEDALAQVRRSLQEGGCDVASIDANYVRGESEIYRKQSDRTKSVAVAE
jgi:tRNA threonylcarbamoyladenosine biosynthesis protein TsaB